VRGLALIHLHEARGGEAQLEVLAEGGLQCVDLGRPGLGHSEGDGAQFETVFARGDGRELVFYAPYLVGKLVVRVDRLAVDREYLVALLQSEPAGRGDDGVFATLGHGHHPVYRVDHGRHERR